MYKLRFIGLNYYFDNEFIKIIIKKLKMINKNCIMPKHIPNHNKNFKRMVKDPQTNSLSVKLLYYLDFLYLKKKTNKAGS